MTSPTDETRAQAAETPLPDFSKPLREWAEKYDLRCATGDTTYDSFTHYCVEQAYRLGRQSAQPPAVTDAVVLADLKKPVCDECGTAIIRDCPSCGAPNCCPKCCADQAAVTDAPGLVEKIHDLIVEYDNANLYTLSKHILGVVQEALVRSSPPVAVEGWKLVPVEPEMEMIEALYGPWLSETAHKARLKAFGEMLNVSPPLHCSADFNFDDPAALSPPSTPKEKL